MNPLLRSLRTASASGASGSMHAYNLGRFGYYLGQYPFINRIKSSGGFTNNPAGVTFDADGWPTLPANSSIQVNVAFVMSDNTGWFPPGNYKVVSTDGVRVQVPDSPGVTLNGTTGGLGLTTFTFTEVPDYTWSNVYIRITVSNATAAPIAMTNLSMHLVAHDARLAAGEVFDPDWLTAHAGARILRNQDWIGSDDANTTYAHVKAFSDFGSQNESKAYYGVGLTPMSIHVKAAKAVGADLWIQLPTGANFTWFDWAADGVMTSMMQQPSGYFAAAPHRYPEGTALGMPTNNDPPVQLAPLQKVGWLTAPVLYYVHVIDATHFTVSTTPGGAVIVPTNGATNVVAAGYNATWTPYTNHDRETDMWRPMIQACFNADPSVRLWVEYSNEVWNPGYVQTGYCQWVDAYHSGQYYPATMFSGSGNGGLAYGYAWACLRAWKLAESIYPPASITRLFAQFTAGSTAKPLTIIDTTGALALGQSIGQIMQSTAARSAFAVAPYLTPTSNDGYSFGGFNAPKIYQENGNTSVIPDSYWTACFEGKTSAANGVGIIAAVDWMTACRAQVDAYAPSVDMVCYEWGQQNVSSGWVSWNGAPDISVANALAIARSFDAWLNGPGGLALYKNGYARTLAPFRVKQICHYWNLGAYGYSETFMQMWQLQIKPLVDTPRSAWFRSI